MNYAIQGNWKLQELVKSGVVLYTSSMPFSVLKLTSIIRIPIMRCSSPIVRMLYPGRLRCNKAVFWRCPSFGGNSNLHLGRDKKSHPNDCRSSRWDSLLYSSYSPRANHDVEFPPTVWRARELSVLPHGLKPSRGSSHLIQVETEPLRRVVTKGF
jgi:hypothetical protein